MQKLENKIDQLIDRTQTITRKYTRHLQVIKPRKLKSKAKNVSEVKQMY